jgi:hypothetical protein
MPSPELRESRETGPDEPLDVRTAWGNWTEAGDLPKPDPAEDKESRNLRDIQDGWPGDDSAAVDADVASHVGETAVRAVHVAESGGGVAAAHEAQVSLDTSQQSLGRLPLDDGEIAARSTDNRVNLADDVPAVDLKPTYDGYLDVVMHGDADGTEAHVRGEVTAFSLEDTAQLIEQTPGWEHRPVRLLSCSTGQDSYAKELANRLSVPVYAPSDVLTVHPDGRTEIENGGGWRRFEPDAH